MPLGCVGELLIQGSTLARGYLNDSTKTKASFIDPPIWAPDRSVRMYKTGDLVKQAADGSYHFVGRKDNQVKVSRPNILCHLTTSSSDTPLSYQIVPLEPVRRRGIVDFHCIR